MEVLAAADLTWPNFEFSVEDLLVDDEPEQEEEGPDAESADSFEKGEQASSISASLEPHSSMELDLIHHNEDVAELEWVSRFVDDSFFEYPETEHRICPATDLLPVVVPVRPRSKRSRGTSASGGLWSEREARNGQKKRRGRKRKHRGQSERRCSHCGAEKTPQWRAGPMGAKTLCNACGVRFKSGRLLPEYRPASSPSFVSSVHSNSHRKVLEMRRKKEGEEPQQLLGFC